MFNPISSSDAAAKKTIDQKCPGWSTDVHWLFFRELLGDPTLCDICMLGVCHGRDIAYIVNLFQRHGRRSYSIVGVDKFEDVPGTDWPEEKHSLSWEQAGFGRAPSLPNTAAALSDLGADARVHLHKGNASDFLNQTDLKFDFIYIDIAHDYEATKEMIRLSLPRLRPNGILGGDDFSNEGTWGVERAVRESFVQFTLFGGWLWTAKPMHFLSARSS